MLSESEIEKIVKDCVSQIYQIAPEQIDRKFRLLEDLEGDSLDTVELVLLLEDKFGITIGEDYARNIRTVDTAVRMVTMFLSEFKKDDVIF